MKKLLAVLLSLIALSIPAFAGCSQDEAINEFDRYEVGYELPVYPSHDFYYKVNDEMTIHITDILVTLTEINTIKQDEILTGEFVPYIFTVKATGETDAKFAGTKVSLYLHLKEDTGKNYYYTAGIGQSGKVEWNYTQSNWFDISPVYFHKITLSA